jgi:hypothetical protein
MVWLEGTRLDRCAEVDMKLWVIELEETGLGAWRSGLTPL